MKTLKFSKAQFKTEELQKTVKLMLDSGFNFYTSFGRWDKNPKVTHGFYEEGEKLAYIQDDYFFGVKYSTVHKSEHGSGHGTGFGLCEEGQFNLSIEDLRKGFSFAPNWAKGDLTKIRKYKGMKDYINSSAVNRITEKIQIVF